MIVTLIIYFLGSIVRLFAVVLPYATEMPLPSAVNDWIPYFHAGASIIGFIIPLDQLFIILGLFLVIQGILLVAYLILLVYGLIRGFMPN